MTIEKIYFSATDDIQLFGLLHKSENIDGKTSDSVVLSVHGMTSTCTKRREDIFAEEFTQNGIDYFCFNNRGADIISYFEKVKDGKLITRIESGSAYEKFEDSYYDIKGAIEMLLNRGYKNIYLQGHSLGAAKSIYTYNKLKQNFEVDILNHIKAVTLLSIVDIPRMARALLGRKFDDVIKEVKSTINAGKGEEIIPREYFLHPISANNFLFFTQIGGTIDLVPFGASEPDFKALNNIDCKLTMTWGADRDLILQKPSNLEEIIRNNVKNVELNIKFIEETGHNYRHKEREVAKFILGTLV